ncbi:DUF4129 domain-containing protein [Streptosporangium amethystogenes subsp. fukuiense]|uniref:DUF4129 domain-containing protein n=1 Tax=Streptosporangium amethystogenes subsp. fukuiense TaxID=698418 RepID=A0ABW2T539_9ACTN
MVPLLTFPFPASPIDIGREEARRRAIQELLGAEYAKEPLVDRLWRGVNQFLGDLLDQESAGVVGSLAARAVLIVIVIGIAVAVFLVARRTARSTSTRAEGLFGDRRLTAAEHREAAERLAAEARWAEAVRERLRAVARDLEDRVIVDSTPGRTAGELAAEAGLALPALAAELAAAARVFDDVTYGEVPGTPEAYRVMCALDEHLRAARPASPVRMGTP